MWYVEVQSLARCIHEQAMSQSSTTYAVRAPILHAGFPGISFVYHGNTARARQMQSSVDMLICIAISTWQHVAVSSHMCVCVCSRACIIIIISRGYASIAVSTWPHLFTKKGLDMIHMYFKKDIWEEDNAVVPIKVCLTVYIEQPDKAKQWYKTSWNATALKVLILS